MKVKIKKTPISEPKVDPKELEMGILVEMEHTKDKNVSKVIALQHLAEDPKYYTKLLNSGLADELNGTKFEKTKKSLLFKWVFELNKAHKYIRREGSPGKYKYIYKEKPSEKKKTEFNKEGWLVDEKGNKFEVYNGTVADLIVKKYKMQGIDLTYEEIPRLGAFIFKKTSKINKPVKMESNISLPSKEEKSNGVGKTKEKNIRKSGTPQEKYEQAKKDKGLFYKKDEKGTWNKVF